MEFIRSYYAVVATLVFIFFLTIAHIVAPPVYSFSQHALSALGAQNYEYKMIMQFGFILFGFILAAGIILNGLNLRTVPIFIYSISIALTGIFCMVPFFGPVGVHYSESESGLHLLFSRVATLAFGIAVLVEMFFSVGARAKRIQILFSLILVIFAGWLVLRLAGNYEGIVQRVLFLVSFGWLILFAPKKMRLR
jgi:hypothetical membrane protein